MKEIKTQPICFRSQLSKIFLLISIIRMTVFTFTTGFCQSAVKQPSKKIHLEGLVTIDGHATSAQVEVHSSHKNKNSVFHTQADKVRGVFRVSLPLHDDYEIVVRVNKFPQQIISLKAELTDTTTYLNIFADFMSPAYDRKIYELQQSILAQQSLKEKSFDGNSFTKKYGHTKKEGLTYQVQIAAYKLVENFNYSAVVGMPKIIRKTDKDYVTRFTMGNYETYQDAFELLKKVQKNNLKEAFIISFYKGEKKFLNQLESDKILP